MDDLSSNRKALEDLWRTRVNAAKLRLESARDHLNEVRRDFGRGAVARRHVGLVYQKALRAEKYAVRQCRRVLEIFTDLVISGKRPNESEWPRGKPTRRNPG